MQPDFEKSNQYASYTQEEQETVKRLASAQKAQNSMDELIIPPDYVVGVEEETEEEGY